MNKRRIFALSLAVSCAGLTAATTLPVSATPTTTHDGMHAVQTGVVRIDPNDPRIAYVTGKYTCPPGTALFVSAKETADGKPDNALKQPGSSAIAAGWLERHPVEGTEYICDNTLRTGTWKIDSFTEYGHGHLVPGQVYLQFCWSGTPTGPDTFAWWSFDEQWAHAA
jgi:hypothetical protein